MQHEMREEWKFDMTWTKLNHYSSSRLQLFFKIECSRSAGSHWRCSLRCWGLQACNFIKKRLQQRCFPVNIAKILRTAFFKEHLGRLLLRLTLSWRRPLSYRIKSIDFAELIIAIKPFHDTHCIKSVQIRSNFWSVFFHIRTEYAEILRISPYSVRMRENTDQK